MDSKKISFGFSKVVKKPALLPTKPTKDENKVELIKCLEGKEIKLVAEKLEAAPLVIQMQTNQKTSAALASLMKRRAVLLGEEEPEPEEAAQSIAEVTAPGVQSLEQRAAREILADVQKNGNETEESEKLVLPALKADELPLDGAKESNLDDYESIPVQQFGLAMLRGMGWKDPPPKKKGAAPIDEAPFLRPKGMGLGADKALKAKPLLVQPESNEVLEIKKQAFVRILGGKLKDQYGQIEGFDDHAGRVIVKMAIGGAKEAFNEFLCQPVSRKEYAQFAKCINTKKYEEYKKQENEHGQIIVKQEEKQKERKPYKEERKHYKEEKEYAGKNSLFLESNQEDRKGYKKEEHEQKVRYSSSSLTASRDSRSGASTSYRERGESSHSSSQRQRAQQTQSSSDEAEDTGESTDSDDSAYERKKHKKSKKKKSKKSKSKHHRRNQSESSSAEESEERSSHRNKHKKKTKKSKRAQSRSRSRSRHR